MSHLAFTAHGPQPARPRACPKPFIVFSGIKGHSTFHFSEARTPFHCSVFALLSSWTLTVILPLKVSCVVGLKKACWLKVSLSHVEDWQKKKKKLHYICGIWWYLTSVLLCCFIGNKFVFLFIHKK